MCSMSACTFHSNIAMFLFGYQLPWTTFIQCDSMENRMIQSKLIAMTFHIHKLFDFKTQKRISNLWSSFPRQNPNRYCLIRFASSSEYQVPRAYTSWSEQTKDRKLPSNLHITLFQRLVLLHRCTLMSKWKSSIMISLQ